MTRSRQLSVPVWCAVAGLLMPVFAGASWMQGGERLSDRDVKQIIEDVNQARDRFEDQLDGKIKASILRSPRGELSVERYLDDLQSNVANLKDRFKTEYSASKEAEVVLQQGTEIHTYIKAQPPDLKGGSEWDTLARQLTRLAAAYWTTFPLPADAAVRRINDGEAASAADQLARDADKFKKQIDQEKTLEKPVRDGTKQDTDALIKQAKIVKSRTADGKPATAEVRLVFELARKIGTFVQGQPSLLPGTTGAWSAVHAPLDKLQQAYGLRAPVPAP